MTPTEKIDAALASVLTCVGLKSDTVIPQSMTERLREAMRKIMAESYIQGSNDAHDAMKGK